jgi:hypothetical protein
LAPCFGQFDVVEIGAWRRLQEQRFPELLFDCGNNKDPGVIYGPDLRDWSHKATTPDQYRMERYIDRFDLRQKRILHVGIGNSGFAKRFHRRVQEIVGTTIDEPELRVAREYRYGNYSVVVHNKYTGSSDSIRGQFDLILDNNPTSPCCCIRHLGEMFGFYTSILKERGQIVTDRMGLGWVAPGSPRRWGFDFDDLAAVAAVAGLQTYRVNRDVYVMSRSAPARPGYVSLSQHLARRAGTFLAKIPTRGPRKLGDLVRELIK